MNYCLLTAPPSWQTHPQVPKRTGHEKMSLYGQEAHAHLDAEDCLLHVLGIFFVEPCKKLEVFRTPGLAVKGGYILRSQWHVHKLQDQMSYRY